MNVQEMFELKAKLEAEAKNHRENHVRFFEREHTRHFREMGKLTLKAKILGLDQQEKQAYGNLLEFQGKIFGEIVITNLDRRWPTLNIYKPNSDHNSCWSSLAWYRAHGNHHYERRPGGRPCGDYIDDGWSWGVQLGSGFSNYRVKNRSLEFPKVNPALDHDGFYEHLPAVYKYLESCGITLLEPNV